MSKERAISRRAWTPERVDALNDCLQGIYIELTLLVTAEERVGDILEKALSVGKDAAEEALEEGIEDGHRQSQAGMK